MRPRIVTVLGGSWESRLVEVARLTGLARVVGRCRRPSEVEARLEGADVVLVGSETPWLFTGSMLNWRRRVWVVGMAAVGDRRAPGLLVDAGCHRVWSQAADPRRLVERLAGLAHPIRTGVVTADARLVWVTGTRGAPGRSEVALGLAWAAAERTRTVLVELDEAAPSLGLRLHLPARPGWADADPARGTVRKHRVGRLQVITNLGSSGGLAARDRVFTALKAQADLVVVDWGPRPPPGEGDCVFVCSADATSVIRAGIVLRAWDGPPPKLVVNKVQPADRVEALRAVRAATGLEPEAVIPFDDRVATTDRPSPRFLGSLTGLVSLLSGNGQGAAAR